MIISNSILAPTESHGSLNFFKNLEKNFNKNPKMIIKICNKRLDHEIKRIITVSDTSIIYQKQKFLLKFITFCSGKAIINTKDSFNYKKTLIKFASEVLKNGLLGYQKPFQQAINDIYSSNTNTLSIANRKFLASIDEVNIGPKNFKLVFSGYLKKLIETTIPIGNFNFSKKLISTLIQKEKTPEEIRLKLKLLLARVFSLQGQLKKSKHIYESIPYNNRSLIVKIEYASILSRLGKFKESKKHLSMTQSELPIKGKKALWGWLFFEKAQLEFSINKDFKTSNDLLTQSESNYKLGKRKKNLFFTNIKRAEFYRKIGKYALARAELSKAKFYLKNYINNPMNLYEYYYQQAFLEFKQKNSEALKQTILLVGRVMSRTGEPHKYQTLIHPLLAYLKKDTKLLKEVVLKKNNYIYCPSKSKEVDSNIK